MDKYSLVDLFASQTPNLRLVLPLPQAFEVLPDPKSKPPCAPFRIPQVQSVTEQKYKRKWTNIQVEKMYKAALDYSQLMRKQPSSLTLADFEYISKNFPQSAIDCMAKFSEVEKSGSFKPGEWAGEEDKILVALAEEQKPWGSIAKAINSMIHEGLEVRSGKQCKERWFTHLCPTINRGPWTDAEDVMLIDGFREVGNKWSKIAKNIPNRSEISIKNRMKSLMNSAKLDASAGGNLEKGIENLLGKKRRKVEDGSESSRSFDGKSENN
jgi:hypothetical protein